MGTVGRRLPRRSRPQRRPRIRRTDRRRARDGQVSRLAAPRRPGAGDRVRWRTRAGVGPFRPALSAAALSCRRGHRSRRQPAGPRRFPVRRAVRPARSKGRRVALAVPVFPWTQQSRDLAAGHPGPAARGRHPRHAAARTAAGGRVGAAPPRAAPARSSPADAVRCRAEPRACCRSRRPGTSGSPAPSLLLHGDDDARGHWTAAPRARGHGVPAPGADTKGDPAGGRGAPGARARTRRAGP